jgi:hypothetical protein
MVSYGIVLLQRKGHPDVHQWQAMISLS